MLRLSTCLFVLLYVVLPCFSQRPRIGIAFGGGGAKGAAEVGVLKVLEEEGVPVDYIAGTSIGAIIGGLYSVGYRADDLRSMFHTADWNMLLSDRRSRHSNVVFSHLPEETYIFSTPMPFLKSKKRKQSGVFSMSKGFVDGLNLENYFSGLTIGYHDVDDFKTLPIPFTAVATDLVSGQEVLLQRGSLPRAIRASMSIPGMFEPVDWGDSLLVDGGILNNIPVDVVRRMGADIVIGIDLSQSQERTKSELRGMSSVLIGLINTMGKRKYKENRDSVDVYIHPDLKGFGVMSFTQTTTDSMYLRGYAAADQLRTELRALAARCAVADGTEESLDTLYNMSLQEDTIPTKQREAKAVVRNTSLGGKAKYSIGPIKIEGISDRDRDWILSKIPLKENSIVTQADIDAGIDALRGLNIFSSVTYSLSSVSPYTLYIYASENKHETINVGARFDSQDLASILVNMSNMPVFATRHHYAVTARISQNPYADLEYHYGNLFGARLGIDYRYRYSDFDRYGKHSKQEALTFHTHNLSLFYLQIFNKSRLKAGVQFDFYHFSKNLSDKDVSEPLSESNHYLNYFVSFLWNSFDRNYFPARGWNITADATLYTDNGGTFSSHSPFYAVACTAEGAYRLTERFSLLPSAQGRGVFGNNRQRIYANYVGGLYNSVYFPQQQSMPTVLYLHTVDDKYASVRATLRYRVKDNIYFSAIGELGKTSNKLNSLLRGKTLWGMSLKASYDFMLGPISVQMMYSSLYRRVGFYINAGFYF